MTSRNARRNQCFFRATGRQIRRPVAREKKITLSERTGICVLQVRQRWKFKGGKHVDFFLWCAACGGSGLRPRIFLNSRWGYGVFLLRGALLLTHLNYVRLRLTSLLRGPSSLRSLSTTLSEIYARCARLTSPSLVVRPYLFFVHSRFATSERDRMFLRPPHGELWG